MIVLDTNVISEVMLLTPKEQVSRWLLEQPSQELFTTTISLAEILYGITLLPLGKRRTALVTVAEKIFGELFAGRLLVFDDRRHVLFRRLQLASAWADGQFPCSTLRSPLSRTRIARLWPRAI